MGLGQHGGPEPARSTRLPPGFLPQLLLSLPLLPPPSGPQPPLSPTTALALRCCLCMWPHRDVPPSSHRHALGPHPLSGHWKSPTVPWLFPTCRKHGLPGPFPRYFVLTGSYFGFLLVPGSWVEGWSQVSLADLPSPSPLYSSTASLSPCFCCSCFCHPVCDGRLVFAGNPVWQHPPLQRVKEDPKYI